MKARVDMQAQRYGQPPQRPTRRPCKASRRRSATPACGSNTPKPVACSKAAAWPAQPRELVAKALSIDPDHPQALDLAGSAAWEASDFALAASHWKRLLAQLAEGSPRHVQLSGAIQRAEQRARFALPAAR